MRGTVLADRFVIEDPLQSADGVAAFVGRDRRTSERVLIKLVDGGRGEAASACAHVDHPAVARLLYVDGGGEGRGGFHVQELVEGPTLRDELDDGAITAERAARVGEALCGALGAAHAAGVVHGAVTSARVIMTTTAPGLKLIDFGLADNVDAQRSAASDVRSVAKLLCVALAPNDTSDSDTAPRLTPVELARWIDAALVADPGARPSALDLAARFADVADALGADALVPSPDALSRLLHEVAHVPHALAPAAFSANPASIAPGSLPSDRFDVRKQLGQGGFGVVYEAFDKTRGAIVAVKTLTRVDGEKLYRFKKEFRALSELVHPNLIRLHELFADGGAWFFSMELVHGVDFVSFVRAQPSALRPCLRQLVDGITAIHAAGRLHRDLKPHNVLVTATGDVKILDFGLVAELSPDDRQTAESAGTPAYMAPETIRSEPPTTATDWYSFGAMLYEALTGVIPFAHASGKNVVVEKLIAEPPAPRSLSSTAPADLDALASALLRREPTARPALDAIRAVTHADANAVALTAPTSTMEIGFFGRTAELDAIRRALADSRSAPVVVVIEGESGIGKSALARRFLSELRELGGAAVLTGRCYERESVPYNAFDGVVDSLSRHLRALPAVDAASVFPRMRDAAMLARLFPVLERVPAWPTSSGDGGPVPVDPHELRSRAFTALRELFARLAERGPLAVFIDDIQWADADSRVLMDALLQQPQPPSLLVLCTARPGRSPTIADADVRCVPLTGLANDDVTAMAAALGVAATTVDTVHVATEARGHPLFVQELLLHGDGAHAAVLDDVLWQRVSQLPPRQRALLDLAALAGAPMSAVVLADAAGASASTTIDDADALRSARLLRAADVADAFEPYHDRIRELVVGRVDGAALKHLALADALERAGAATDDPRVLVRHLEAARENARAAVHAERAAELAHAALAFDQAATLFQAALRLGAPNADGARRLQARLALALDHGGRCAEAADAYLGAAHGADDAVRLPLVAKAVAHLFASGHRARALDLMRELLVALGETWPPTERGVLISIVWRRARLRLRGLRFTPRPRATLDARTRLFLQLFDDLTLVVGYTDVLRNYALQARVLHVALDAGDELFIAAGLAREALALIIDDPKKLVAAHALLARARAVVPAPPANLRALFDSMMGSIEFYAGRPRTAADRLVLAETTYREETSGTSWQSDSVHIHRLGAHRVMASLGEICRNYDGCVGDAIRRGARVQEHCLKSLFSIRWLAVDNVAEARRTLERGRELHEVAGPINLQMVGALSARIDADLYAGDTAGSLERIRDDVDAVKRSNLLRIYRARVEHWSYLGRLALAEAARTGAQRHIDGAEKMARRLAREPSPHATARELLLSAGVANQRGDVDGAVAQLRRTVAHADAEGMIGIAAIARRRLGVLVGGDEGRALVAAADATLRAECVKVPELIVDVYAPGLAPR